MSGEAHRWIWSFGGQGQGVSETTQYKHIGTFLQLSLSSKTGISILGTVV